MRRPSNVIRRGTLLAVLAFWGFAPHSAAAQDPAAPASADPIVERLNDLDARVSRVGDDLEWYRSRALWFGTIGGLVVAVVGFFGYQSIRDGIRRVVERNLEKEISTALEKSLPSVLSDTQAKAEDFLLRLAKLLALRAYGAYDEALMEYGWNGHVSSLRDETSILRRAIIECLYSAKKDRPKKREAAWEAVTELVQDDTSAETNRLYLRLAVNTRRYPDGLAFLERLRDEILSDKESALRAATLLRRVGRLTEALEIATRYKDDDDLESIVTVAVLRRDLGRFDSVHDVLLPAVNRLISDPAAKLPDGWHRLVNTFVANSLDRARPGDAVRPAEFVMRSAPGPVEIFTVGRLILALPSEHPSRAALLDRFREAIPQLLPGEATVRCQAVLHQIDGEPDRAIAVLQAAIDEGTLPQGQGMKPDVYFQRCSMAQVLIAQNRTEGAIDTLMPASGFIYGGEAKFLLAVAYAKQGESRDAARWLAQAVQESPKWAGHARDNDVLKAVPEVAQELAKAGRS